MLKDKIIAFSIIFLSISIIIGANVIAHGLRDGGGNILSGLINTSSGINNIGNAQRDIVNMIQKANSDNEVSKENRFDLAAAASYLGVTEDSLEKIIKNKNAGIPYIKMGEFYILNKTSLNKWLETARVEIE